MIGGELVREARKRAGISQAELARRASTTQSAIARLESGRTRPAFEDVERLMRLCGFKLIVELAPNDDSDLEQARRNLRSITPSHRLHALGRSVSRLQALRDEAGLAR